ncbi:MAG: peptidylprolyl isomerase [Sporichthyaceae bacterium]
MAGSGKQTSAERRKERAAAERQAALRARRERRTKIITGGVIGLLVVGLVAGGVVGAISLFDDDTESVTSLGDSTPTPDPSASPGSTATPTPPPAGKVACTYLPDPRGSSGVDAGTPPGFADTKTAQFVTMEINKKPVVVELDPAAAPCAVNSFVHLVEEKYFDDTPCHRELNAPGNYVLQCGDPTGTGSGGPGYFFSDENLENATYEKGIIAMANSGPNTNGSQFFMMFDDSEFPPAYVPFGKIISGIEVLTKIGEAGVTGPSNDTPKEEVTISKMTVSDSKPEA